MVTSTNKIGFQINTYCIEITKIVKYEFTEHKQKEIKESISYNKTFGKSSLRVADSCACITKYSRKCF